jgi:hypothetical protein
MLYHLCNGDITKWEEVTKKNFIFCLNWFSYERLKREVDEQEMKKRLEKIK